MKSNKDYSMTRRGFVRSTTAAMAAVSAGGLSAACAADKPNR